MIKPRRFAVTAVDATFSHCWTEIRVFWDVIVRRLANCFWRFEESFVLYLQLWHLHSDAPTVRTRFQFIRAVGVAGCCSDWMM